MGFIDNVRRALARHLSGPVAAKAARSVGATVEALADDLASTAEAELAERRAAQDRRLASLEGAAASIREERAARRAAAVEELARRKETAERGRGAASWDEAGSRPAEDDDPAPHAE